MLGLGGRVSRKVKRPEGLTWAKVCVAGWIGALKVVRK